METEDVKSDVSERQKDPLASYIVVYQKNNKVIAKNNEGKIVDSGSSTADCASVINSAITDADAQTYKANVILKDHYYPLETSVLPVSYVSIKAHNEFGQAQLRPIGDYPAIHIDGSSSSKSRIVLKGLYLSHDQKGYTSGLATLSGNVTSVTFDKVYLYDFEKKIGYGIKLYQPNSTGMYKINFHNCEIYGFASSIYASITNAHGWINSNKWVSCDFWNPIKVLTVNSVSSAGFDSNKFIGCDGHAYSGTTCGFDYDTSGHSYYCTHIGCMVWDLPACSNYANVNTMTELDLIDCVPDYKIGGSGANSGKVIRRSQYTYNYGTLTITAGQTSKSVSHGLATAPTRVYLSPTADTGAKRYWTSAKASTTFTVSLDSAHDADISFDWIVQV